MIKLDPLLKPFKDFFDKKREASPGLCGLYLASNKLVISHILPGSPLKKLTFIEASSCQLSSLKLILQSLIQKHGLNFSRASLVLSPEDYQLMLLDKPAVPDEEVSAAVRWQLKSFISYSPSEALVECFSAPVQSGGNKVFVVAAEAAKVQGLADVISDTGLRLEYIDIPELALRNINVLAGDQDNFLGLLVTSPDSFYFIITYQGELLLSLRREVVGEPSQEWFQELATEIQRAFTFAKKQQHEVSHKLLLATDQESFHQGLSALLIDTPIEKLELQKLLDSEVVLQADESWSLEDLISIGGALRGGDDARN